MNGLQRAYNPAAYSSLCIQDLYRPDDDFFYGTTWWTKEGIVESKVKTTTPVAGSSWGNPPSGVARGVSRGSPASPAIDDDADQKQMRILKLERPQ
jgi:hypothetical protein